jgi:PrgI family protein
MDDDHSGYTTVRIPADVNKPDLLLGPWSARQAAILGGTALGLWATWQATRTWLGPLLFLPPALLVLLIVAAVVSTERDGVGMDRLLASALRQAIAPRRRVLAPEGVSDPPQFLREALAGQPVSNAAPLELPVREVDDSGVLDLGRDGASVLASASTVNFSLRTGAEQEVLLSGFARWLNTLTGPVQIASRTAPADLSAQISGLREKAAGLPHPLLEQAANDHADFLEQLSASRSLLTRRVLIAGHEPDRAAGQRLLRRAHDSAAVLAGCEVNVAVLDHNTASEALACAFDPDQATAPNR